MNNRKEIHGFELVVGELVANLDALFTEQVLGWKPIKYGLKLEIEEVEKSAHRDCWSKYAPPRRSGYWRVGIYPAGWPLDSSIMVIFEGPKSYYFQRWRAVEGFIHLRRHDGSSHNVSFEVLSEPIFCIIPKDPWTTEGEILGKTLREYLNEQCAVRFEEYLTKVVTPKLQCAITKGNAFLEDFWGQISDTFERTVKILKPHRMQREEG